MFSYFAWFFISGFCGILYELIWLRLAMGQFGVTTSLVSIVLSVFMAGTGIGLLGSGWLIRRYKDRIVFSPLFLYSVTESFVAVSALTVPGELGVGHHLLVHLTTSMSLSSGQIYFLSGGLIALTLLPWAACMGATIPLGMFAIECDRKVDSRRSFTFLYLSNVLGATLGGILPLLFIELWGFHFALRIGAVLNVIIASTALVAALIKPKPALAVTNDLPPSTANQSFSILSLLFMTGMTTMGMEVVWIRMFTPFVGVMVYSFAMILVVYLTATFIGSLSCREARSIGRPVSRWTWASLMFLGSLPVIFCDPRISVGVAGRVVLGIAPFSAAAGYLTPKLVENWSGGNPVRAAYAYVANIAGCILGPLVAGFLLLPRFIESWVLLLFGLPWLFVSFSTRMSQEPRTRRIFPALVFAMLTMAVFLSFRSFETIFPKRQVMRDYTATVTAAGDGMSKQLLVNGVSMTGLSPITKAMAHFPLAFLNQPPQNALIICFGMGTTFRSVHSWNISATAVDLIPSVPKMFPYYHSDAAEVLKSPLSHVVVDDGRRFLERTTEQYDVVTIDPPPPIETAGSSLLYSEEFYRVAKRHLKPQGILQQWLPSGDAVVRSSVTKALEASFTYVRVFHSVTGEGYHFLASDLVIPQRNSQELAERLPPSAAEDFVEWGPAPTAAGQFQILLNNEIPLNRMTADAPDAPAMEDDRPTNEYFIWRLLSSHPSARDQRH